MPNALPVTSSPALTSLRSDPPTQGVQSERGHQGLSSLLRSEPPKLAHRHSLEQQQQQSHPSSQPNNGLLRVEGRLSLEQAHQDHHHSEARLSLEHAQSLAERALRLEQERRLGGGHDRKQDQRQQQDQQRQQDQRQQDQRQRDQKHHDQVRIREAAAADSK